MPNPDTSPAALRALAAEADYAMDLNALVKWAVKVRKLLRTLAAIAAEKEAATKSHDPNRAGIAQATAMARNDIRRAFDRDEITAEDYRRMNDELDKSAGIVRAAPKPPMSAAEKEASDRVPGCEAPARVLAEWLGYAWDGLHDRDISNRYPDWVYDDIGGKKFQGGRPALRRVAQAMLATATVKSGLTVGATDRPERLWLSAPDADGDHGVWFDAGEGGTEYVRADIADDLRASLAAAQQERDEALRDAIEFTQKVDAGLVRDEEYLRLHREKMEQYDRRVAAEARAEKAEAERDASRWQPIETAPKDRPILAWCDHEADPYSVDDKTLTTYAAHAEGLGHAPTGCHIVEWGGGWTESYEDGGGEMSDWWFVAGSEFEVAANPTHWMPLPASPANPENPAHD